VDLLPRSANNKDKHLLVNSQDRAAAAEAAVMAGANQGRQGINV
jgi:hypothetical protein